MISAGFSTLGCPALPVDEVLALAHRHDATLVEPRISPDEPVHTELSDQERIAVRAAFAEAGIRIGPLATYLTLADPDLSRPLDAHLQLAVDLGSPALRLFPGAVPLPVAADRLRAAVAAADGTGVRITVETHDDYLSGARIRELITAADGGAGAVWDVLHTWRSGETVADTLAALRDHLAELQIKDVASAADLRPLVPGTGALPLREAIRAAVTAGFTGPIVLEHEAKWYPDAAPIEPALAAALRLIVD